MYLTTTGLILRETEYRETSRILTVLTADRGKLTVSAKGARRKGSRVAASTQLLCYSELTLFASRDRFTLTEARSLEEFRGLRDSVGALALGAYFAELLDAVSDEDVPDPELLSLGLNALFAVSEGKNTRSIIKAAFELRLACIAGFAPQLDACDVCGRADLVRPALSLSGGVICCRDCGGAADGVELSPDVLRAMRYVVSAPAKRLYSFRLSDEAERGLSDVAERYLMAMLGRRFATLDFYREVGEL